MYLSITNKLQGGGFSGIILAVAIAKIDLFPGLEIKNVPNEQIASIRINLYFLVFIWCLLKAHQTSIEITENMEYYYNP